MTPQDHLFLIYGCMSGRADESLKKLMWQAICSKTLKMRFTFMSSHDICAIRYAFHFFNNWPQSLLTHLPPTPSLSLWSLPVVYPNSVEIATTYICPGLSFFRNDFIQVENFQKQNIKHNMKELETITYVGWCNSGYFPGS